MVPITTEEFVVLVGKRQTEGRLKDWEIKQELEEKYEVSKGNMTTKK
jgi:hypothetical protein